MSTPNQKIVHHPRYLRWWLGLQVAAWLFTVPTKLHARSLSSLLADLTRRHKAPAPTALTQREVVRIVTRVCRLRLFRLSVFPRHCLLQSLALYRTCNRYGFPVEMHVGVLNDDGTLRAHSWVTLAGKVVAETCDPRSFREIYSHGAAPISGAA